MADRPCFLLKLEVVADEEVGAVGVLVLFEGDNCILRLDFNIPL